MLDHARRLEHSFLLGITGIFIAWALQRTAVTIGLPVFSSPNLEWRWPEVASWT